MPEEDYVFTPASQLMQHDEIFEIAKVFTHHGIKKIRLTGGEPLVRKDAARIIESLASLPVELTMTTNGTRLHEFMPLLKQTGVTSLNISLDTLQESKFLLMTRRDQFGIVHKNINKLLDEGFRVKVNMVAMKGLNEQEVPDFVAWTKDSPVEVRFIEFMPFSGNRWTSNKVFTLQEMLELVSRHYSFEAVTTDVHDTAKQYKVPGHAGSFAVISTMSAPFCGSCNRVRLTADGKMKNCLFSKHETDLLTAFRNGQDITPLIQSSILEKAKELGGQFSSAFEKIHPEEIDNRSMITIGG